MPNKKGYIPWNKGLTKETDSRVISSAKKIYFSDEDKKKIISLYIDGHSAAYIGEIMGCSSHPIGDYLVSVNLRRNYSEVRKIVSSRKRKRICEYVYDGKVLKVIDGYVDIESGKLHKKSKLQVECVLCNKVFEIKFSGYKSKLKHNNNVIYCNSCSHYMSWMKHDQNIKTSSQQKSICDMIGGELNYKISGLHVDIVLKNEKIIIEYDGWFWHGKEQKRDRRRDEYLKSLGWRILRIKSNRKMPTKEQLDNSLSILRNNEHKYTEIVLDDWGVGKTSRIQNSKKIFYRIVSNSDHLQPEN